MELLQGLVGPYSDYLRRAIEERESESVRVDAGRTSAASAAANATELIAQSVDHKTGRVQTFRLALWVADATKRDLEAAAEAYAALESQLLPRGSGEVARFNQDIVESLRTSAEYGGPALAGRARRGERLLVDNPILAKSWPSTAGAWTGLRSLLEGNGLRLLPVTKPLPLLTHGPLAPANGVASESPSATR